MWAPSRTMILASPTPHVHEVVSPLGGSATLRPQKLSRKPTKAAAAPGRSAARVRQRSGPATDGPVTPVGHGMSGGAGIRSR